MSQDIIHEVTFLLHALLLGVFITFIYDWLLIARKVISHTSWLVSLEDMCFWIGCALSVFYMLYEENNGALRWFAVAGATLGMLIYKKTVSRYIISIAVKIFTAVWKAVTKLFGILIKPVKAVLSKLIKKKQAVSQKSMTLGKYIKKKLTEYIKLLKMILCKQ